MQLDLVDEDIYENDELKHWGIEGMHWYEGKYYKNMDDYINALIKDI